MSFIITPADLNGMTEPQLRAKRVAIMGDLAARDLRLEDCPHVQVSIRFIDEALARVMRTRPKGPGFRPH